MTTKESAELPVVPEGECLYLLDADIVDILPLHVQRDVAEYRREHGDKGLYVDVSYTFYHGYRGTHLEPPEPAQANTSSVRLLGNEILAQIPQHLLDAMEAALVAKRTERDA